MIGRIGKRSIFKAGATIVVEGTSDDKLFLLMNGEVEARKRSDDGEDITLGRILPGEVFGEMAMIDGEPHMASVIAIADSEVTVISKIDFQRYLEDTDVLMRGIIDGMARRIRSMGELLVDEHAKRRSS
jgi:CRP/FNR family cyclic AMP-dependent transcriptional regulator